jgi:uncharacterized RDD family membrane protein YckC
MPWQNEGPTASSRLLPPGLVFSDTPSRLVAYLLDSIVIAVLFSVPLALLGGYDFAYPDFPDRNVMIVGALISLSLQVIFFVWFWSGGRRATPGQRVMRIQVANAFDGQPLSLRQAVKRWIGLGFWINFPLVLPYMVHAIASTVIAAIWWLVLLITTAASPTKQGLHDRFAGSALVRPAGVGNRWAVGCVVILAIFVVVEAVFVVWMFTNPEANYLPTDFWDAYLRWLWPS